MTASVDVSSSSMNRSDARALGFKNAAEAIASDYLHSTPSLSVYLGVATATLASWAAKGCGPPFLKVGHLRRYRHADVLEWLEKRRVVPTRETEAPELVGAEA